MKSIMFLFVCFAAFVLQAGPVIWLIGDSTVANYPEKRTPLAGWGQVLNEYCNADVTINNKAVPGATTHSFRKGKHWDKVISKINKGDFLFIQFGNNDHYPHDPPLGVALVSTDDYKKNLKKYVNEAKAKGAIPILVTPMCRRVFGENGKISKSFDNYPDTMKEAAKETGTPLIDLYEISFTEFGKMTKEQTKKLFLFLPPGKYAAFPKGKHDGVHFQLYGARKLAEWVVKDAKKQELSISKLLK